MGGEAAPVGRDDGRWGRGDALGQSVAAKFDRRRRQLRRMILYGLMVPCKDYRPIADHPVPPCRDGDVDGQVGAKHQNDDNRDFNEHALQLYMHKRRAAVINKSKVVNYRELS